MLFGKHQAAIYVQTNLVLFALYGQETVSRVFINFVTAR
jgi:hypothetical protein